MKMSSFLFLSMVLHAAALAYPALFLDSRVAAPVIVTLLEADRGSRGANGSTGGGAAPQRKPAPPAPQASAEKRHEPPVVEPERMAARPEQVVVLPQPISVPPVVVTDVPAGIVIAARQSDSAAAVEISVRSGGAVKNLSASSGGDASGGGNGIGGGGRTRGGGNGTGGSGSAGVGAGAGDGKGDGSGRSLSVKASYDSCPRPETPEIARKNRWEGTVTLRVLVDELGRPQSLEVNRSSGFPVLDQAAIDNIKQRCRFHPAREGEKRVASWIRIPVVFPLAEVKTR